MSHKIYTIILTIGIITVFFLDLAVGGPDPINWIGPLYLAFLLILNVIYRRSQRKRTQAMKATAKK
jgi:hypothetical protein